MAGRKKREGPVNYFELPRKQLQSLCKKYGYPANKTNLLMAEFLTAHLNSNEYLNRDKSLPSPAVRTRFQCFDEEQTTDDKLATIPESQPSILDIDARRLSHEFTVSIEAEHNDRSLEASKAAEPSLGEEVEMSPSQVRIRYARRQKKTEQVTPLPPSSTEEATNITKGSDTEGTSPGFSIQSEAEAMDSESSGSHSQDLSMESQESQGTPLPLSVMPYMRLDTPDDRTSSEKGVKLFVDLKIDGVSPGENLRDYYEAWGAPRALPTWNVTETREEGALPSLKASEEPAKNLPILENCTTDDVMETDREGEVHEGTKNLSLQEEVAEVSTSCKKADVAPLKSCLLTPTRRPSSLSVSFLLPPIFLSPRSNNSRSDIVKEWGEQTQETILPIDVISSSSADNTALNGERVLRKLDQNIQAKQPAELKTRMLQLPADMESPPVGIVTEAVKTYEEQRLCNSRGPSSIKRKDCYKASPFSKSSRIGAELDRASKLGQIRRDGILALKRAMGVTPLISDSQQEVDKEAQDNSTSSPALQTYATTLSTAEEGSEKDESTRVETDTSRDNVEGIEARMMADEVADEGANLPFTVEELVANLTWMTRPIQVPARKPVPPKHKAKPVRPFSTSGRTLELMENASAKLKMLRKSTAIKGEAMSKPNKSCASADRKGSEFRGCAEQVEPSAEVEMTEEAAENPVAELENDMNNISPEETSSQSDMVDCSMDGHQAEQGNSAMMQDEKRKEGEDNSAAKMENEVHSISPEGDSDMVDSTDSRQGNSSFSEEAVKLVAELENNVHSISHERTSTQSEMVAFTDSHQAEEQTSSMMEDEISIVEDEKRKEGADNSIVILENEVRSILPEGTSSQSEMLESTESHQATEEHSSMVEDEKLQEENPTPIWENDVHSVLAEVTSNQSEMVDSNDSHQAEEGSVLEDKKREEDAFEALINGGVGEETGAELNVQRAPDTTEFGRIEPEEKAAERPNEKPAEKTNLASSFLSIDFKKMTFQNQNAGGGPPPRVEEVEIESTKVKEQISAEKCTPLSPLDGNRLTIDKVFDSSQNPTAPTKPFGILDVLSEEGEGKNNINGFSFCGKENEWSRRQEQHKSPLTGRSREKSLRTAEKKASSLREQLLKKRRGMMMEEQIDGSESVVQGIDSSPLKHRASNRLL
ncbi:unnamed protein product [Calypogeia fissa]